MHPDHLPEAKKVATLIIGYLNRTLSGQQRKELDDWLSESRENMELFEKLTDENHLEESMQWFKRLDRQVTIPRGGLRARTSFNPRPILWAAAAVVVLGVGLWIFYYGAGINSIQEKVAIVAADSVMPGGSKAVLITASGEQVNLGNEKGRSISLGSGAVARDEGEQLVYRPNAESSNNILKVPAGGQYKVVLADGTKVWLNSISVLKYPTSFNSSVRKVELEGEGYFEVEKNKQQPFEVHCGSNTTIQVTGTQFNVNSYESENEQRITLIEGGINLVIDERSVAMNAGQKGIITGDNIVSIANDPTADEAIAWTKGLFSFNKTPIEEVMLQLGRWYDVRVVYEGKPARQFTGNIPMTSPIQSALQMLEISGNIHFTLSGKTVTVRP